MVPHPFTTHRGEAISVLLNTSLTFTQSWIYKVCSLSVPCACIYVYPVDDRGNTPLHDACSQGFVGVAVHLLKHNADNRIMSSYSHYTLSICVSSPLVTDGNGKTALGCAIDGRNNDVADLFWNNKVTIFAP